MISNRIQNIAVRMIEKQSISVEDVKDLQAGVEEGGFITPGEAEALIRVERLVPLACDSWGEFLVETLTAHYVWERTPTGRITGEDVVSILDAFADGQAVRRSLLGDLLFSIVRHAVQSDERLVALVLADNADRAKRTEPADAPAVRDAA
jgi:hypothetical protein